MKFETLCFVLLVVALLLASGLYYNHQKSDCDARGGVLVRGAGWDDARRTKHPAIETTAQGTPATDRGNGCRLHCASKGGFLVAAAHRPLGQFFLRPPVSRPGVLVRFQQLSQQPTMTLDPKSPRVEIDYLCIGGPLNGQTVAVDGRTELFFYFEGIGLKGALTAGDQATSRRRMTPRRSQTACSFPSRTAARSSAAASMRARVGHRI
jgi:hypothetical protein